jgi:hypothetical protein
MLGVAGHRGDPVPGGVQVPADGRAHVPRPPKDEDVLHGSEITGRQHDSSSLTSRF